MAFPILLIDLDTVQQHLMSTGLLYYVDMHFHQAPSMDSLITFETSSTTNAVSSALWKSSISLAYSEADIQPNSTRPTVFTQYSQRLSINSQHEFQVTLLLRKRA